MKAQIMRMNYKNYTRYKLHSRGYRVILYRQSIYYLYYKYMIRILYVTYLKHANNRGKYLNELFRSNVKYVYIYNSMYRITR